MLSVIALFGCEKYGDSSLNGEIYEYSNGQTGRYKISVRYEFQKSGNVCYSSKVGYSSEFNTEGCNLYYTLVGNNLTIFYGVKGWKENVQNKVFASGTYHNNYIIMQDKVFMRK